MKTFWIIMGLGLYVLSPLASQAADLSLYALFKDKAIVKVDGTQRMLTVGQVSPEGVKLISTSTETEEAVVELAGKSQTLRLGVVISAFESSKNPAITLYAGQGGHFFANGYINDKPVQFLVDTGATTIAMSGRDADRLGIDYKRLGNPGFSRTASGVVRIFQLSLQRVRIDSETLHNVQAGVIEGNHPPYVLLGMSFLNAFEMKRDGDKMELIRRY